MWLIPIILIFLLLMMPIVTSSYAATNIKLYSIIGLKIINPNPIMCIMEPYETLQPQFWSVDFINTIISASQEWANTMNKVGGNWDISYEFHYWEDHKDKSTSDYKQCNIFVIFNNEIKRNELGRTQYSYSNSSHKYAIITIHTLFPSTFIDISEYNKNIIRHVLGLGHYQNPHDKNSIMKPFLNHKECSQNRTITNVEIFMLLMLYGEDGFELRHNPIGLDKIIIIE